MKIIEQREPFFVEFDQLEDGDVFRYLYFREETPTTFIKIEGRYQAVNLETGKIAYFELEAQCEPLNAKLIISPKEG